MLRPAVVTAVLAGAVLGLAGCGSSGGGSTSSNGDAPSSGAGVTEVTVTSSDTACDLSATTGPAGQYTFKVTNSGGAVTEFYVLADGGARIVGEVENVGPELTRDLTVVLKAGDYTTACKPGMVGDGIQAPFTVTGDAGVVTDDQGLVEAAAQYRAWVASQAKGLQAATKEFVAAVRAGDLAKAKQLYPESFGDLDPRLDARVNDVEEGQEWTGWHRLEKALWKDRSLAGTARYVDLLETDTEELVTRIVLVELTADQVTNGAKELLDEVAKGKVAGEEERYSHTDLWDFQANVDGAKKAYEVVADVVAAKDPQLKAELDARFADLNAGLAVYKMGNGYVLYTDLTAAQVKDLAAKVEALSEPLSELTATVTS
jgi:iron uptake system component EfeO